MNKIVTALAVSLLFFTCKQPSNYEKMELLLHNQFEFDSLRVIDHIVVINELGDCLNCNNSFSVAMSKYIESENVLFIICGTGSRVDISPYYNSTSNHVIWDRRNSFNELNMVGSSAIINLKNQKIDSIIEIKLGTRYNDLLPSLSKNKF
tara:strand:- start:38620 stop:39069 length:450 start_codon:yes stop_codon:yes gene_type:complete